jgi:hypothetical protein
VLAQNAGRDAAVTRSRELIKAEIVSQLQQQSLAILVDSRRGPGQISELEAKLQQESLKRWP